MSDFAHRPACRGWGWAVSALLAAGGSAWAQQEPQQQPEQSQPPAATPPAAPEPVPTPATPPQTEPSPAAPSPFGLGAIDYHLRAYSSYEIDAGINHDPGEVSVFRAGAEFDAALPIDEHSRMRLEAHSEYVNFDFNNENKFNVGGKTAIEEASNHDLRLTYEHSYDNKWSWLVSAAGHDGLQGGANAADGLSGDISAGAMYEIAPGFRLGGGLLVWWPVEHDMYILPVPYVSSDVALTDHWRLVLNIPRWGGFVYSPSRDVSLRFGVALRYNEYRLSDTSSVPEGVFREYAFPATAELDWRFAPAWTLQAGIGTNLYQRFNLDDKSGHDVSTGHTDLAPTFSLGVTWSF